MAFEFCVLGSGSSGNSTAFWDSETMFLVDAGFSCKATIARMGRAGLDAKVLKTVFLSHEHSDHICGARVLQKRFSPEILTTKPVQQWLDARHGLGTSPMLKPGKPLGLGAFSVTPFEVCHDASQTVGFSVSHGQSRVVMATDLGHVNPEVLGMFKGADAIIIESNHDVQMLKDGPYPEFLKRRILGLQGHLSNAQSAEALVSAVGEDTRHVTLAHLSQENNTPEKALGEAQDALASAGKRVEVSPASQFDIGDIIKLR
jgi:phosphoribosyl 1,2-cyclic phosphodiesterase